MLTLEGASFTVGRSRFADHVPGSLERTAKIYVKVLVAGQIVMAQLDTGAPYSILESELVDDSGLLVNGPEVKLRTAYGLRSGCLGSIRLVLVADEGDSLDIDATVFVCPDWPEGQNFLGYSGFLERIRVGLDPSENQFYFGPSLTLHGV